MPQHTHDRPAVHRVASSPGCTLHLHASISGSQGTSFQLTSGGSLPRTAGRQERDDADFADNLLHPPRLERQWTSSSSQRHGRSRQASGAFLAPAA